MAGYRSKIYNCIRVNERINEQPYHTDFQIQTSIQNISLIPVMVASAIITHDRKILFVM